jgi:hypothetical protein
VCSFYCVWRSGVAEISRSNFRSGDLHSWVLGQNFHAGLQQSVSKIRGSKATLRGGMRMGRPVGVTILAILNFIGAAFCLLGGIAMILGGGFIATMLSQQGQGSAGAAGILAGLGAAAGVFIIIIGGVSALVGFGMWKLKGWARIVSIVLFAISAVMQLLGLLGSLAHFNVFAVVWSLFWVAVDAFVIWYLLKPEVKAAFQPPAQARAASA